MPRPLQIELVFIRLPSEKIELVGRVEKENEYHYKNLMGMTSYMIESLPSLSKKHPGCHSSHNL